MISLHYETNPNSPKQDKDSMMYNVPLKLGDTSFIYFDPDPDHIYHGKLLHGKWVVHCEDGPAIIYPDCVWFFYNGVNYMIPNMPIDNETKLMLALKYSLNTDYSVGFATYVQ